MRGESGALRTPQPPSSSRMILYALADDSETIETFSTLEEAQAALETVLADEPGWAGRIRVVELELEVA